MFYHSQEQLFFCRNLTWWNPCNNSFISDKAFVIKKETNQLKIKGINEGFYSFISDKVFAENDNKRTNQLKIKRIKFHSSIVLTTSCRSIKTKMYKSYDIEDHQDEEFPFFHPQ